LFLKYRDALDDENADRGGMIPGLLFCRVKKAFNCMFNDRLLDRRDRKDDDDG
jgi:hypothetical protein